MIINTKTLTGKQITINVADSTVTIPQGDFSYEGPVVIVHDKKPTAALKIDIQGQTICALISNEVRDTIIIERAKIEEDRLEALFPGVTLLKVAHLSEAAYLEAFSKMMDEENNDGVNPPKAPKMNIDDLSAKYPRAVLYLRAESYASASNIDKWSAGQQAVEILKNGGSDAEAADILNNWSRGIKD